MAELAQRANGLWRHRHGADGPGAFGDAVAVISAKPICGCSSGALGYGDITNQITDESGAELSNRQPITQCLNEVVGQVISGDLLGQLPCGDDSRSS